ncbi:MAG TPA: HAMP domain-containing sensor histidine kinase [Coriobacteriia bacterium]|nr:HAMP domain-containing sensor histidine kinase [Coriobacteriia bacterium]
MKGTLRQRLVRTIVIAAACGAALPVLVLMATTFGAVDSTPVVLSLSVAAAAVAALAAWPIAMAVARRTTAPIEKLAASAASFAAGDHSKRATTEGPREVRRIAESFNRMADEVAAVLSQLSSEETRKTQFVSDVSHELRTPLTAIRGAAETLLDGGVSADDQERFLSTIATEAERLTRLANDLLALQRIEGATGELPFRRTDLKDAANRAVTMLEPLIEDRGVDVLVSGSAPLVLGDIDRLQQVVANLVDNATRMVGEGGHVWVELSRDEEQAVLAVRDDGPGIPEQDLANLFDRFYRPDTSRARSRGGAGLGLAIVRAIVTSHGGTIEAENLPECGARLTVRLPALPH